MIKIDEPINVYGEKLEICGVIQLLISIEMARVVGVKVTLVRIQFVLALRRSF
tara:strand:+ start:341 stop:499 length:159 start_codon:yes stop_codon:yes gene_type:complete